MQQQPFVIRWCERLIEAGWLLCISLIPIYFNLLSSRHFEPDKATTLRAIVLMMAVFAVIRLIEYRRLATPASAPSGSIIGDAWRTLVNTPLAIPLLFYVVVFIIATIWSVVPHISFWGSYQRLQGTYTNLSYVGLFLIIMTTLRRRDQLERLITIALMTAVVVSCYGVLQHLEQDPLPWKGDVTERVASTMGNAIFVAAYLIMIVPLGLYRIITGISAIKYTPTAAPHAPSIDIGWAVAHSLLIIGTIALVLGAITFGASVQSIDLRYWWVFPGAIILVTALWTLLPSPPGVDDSARTGVKIWPAVLFVAYVFALSSLFNIGQASTETIVQATQDRLTLGMRWSTWIWVSIGAVGIFYLLASQLPTRSLEASPTTRWLHLLSSVIITALIFITIVFTQSRGPWLGISVGLFVFFFLLLWQGMRQARADGATTTALWLQRALWAWGALSIVAGAFLLALNLSDMPIFHQLRATPYIGRFGTLTETRFGTGRVRYLIWNGDEHAGGARQLIVADPMRTLIGWGPESMFVAFNPFYPPSLAEVESRGASPDRSHQAMLDEMVTRGVLGLVSYFFLLISFFAWGWHLMRRSVEWHWQVFFIATTSMVVSHIVEGITGIPIVSTLMMWWVTMAITISGGILAGHVTLGSRPTAAPAPAPQEPSEANVDDSSTNTTPPPPTPHTTPPTSRKKQRQRGQPATSSGRGVPTGSGRPVPRGKAEPLSPPLLGLYAFLILTTMAVVWQFNLRPVYADMKFNTGQNYSAQPNATLSNHVRAMDYFLTTIRNNVNEDFYYLNLGRVLMQIADRQRAEGTPLGEPDPKERTADHEICVVIADKTSDTPILTREHGMSPEQIDRMVRELLSLSDVPAVVEFVQAQSPLQLMLYAEAVLERARELNPCNKDHYANLGRLNNFWFSWSSDIERLEDSVSWYNAANRVAPQDVVLLNESALAAIRLGETLEALGPNNPHASYYDHARQLLERSLYLDQTYGETITNIMGLYVLQGDREAVVNLFLTQLERDPHAMDIFLEASMDWLSENPDDLQLLRDAYASYAGNDAFLHSVVGMFSVAMGDEERALKAYARAVQLDPENLEHRLNYTILLSDTHAYSEALEQAEAGLALAKTPEKPNEKKEEKEQEEAEKKKRERQKQREEKVAQFTYLVSILEHRLAGRP